ncbi:hypothetical protein LSG31_12080 [Fodinisporobacter ferrooxydans]|uniref:Uncharacterized protein n=1 Tax=Fodinisporobacter ferrooxydans TaxID=2901836 RepID=A0ABY4CE38_9BACL|nr:hypothetical protein LSG31_12080 [Alicyclobacillaceae bacterium MYW30-H2]
MKSVVSGTIHNKRQQIVTEDGMIQKIGQLSAIGRRGMFARRQVHNLRHQLVVLSLHYLYFEESLCAPCKRYLKLSNIY